MENRRSLSQPLISSTSPSPTTTPTSPHLSNHAIALRLLLVAVVGLTSLWANHEASKGFDITILNNAKGSSAGQRFDLFYVSNDEATRLLLNASNFIQNLIYPSHHLPKKIIKSVHLTLSLRDLPSNVAVEQLDGGVDFAVHLSPSIFNGTNMNHAMSTAVLRGMSRVWLWNGEGHAPPSLLDGMVEHIVATAGFVEKKYPGGAVSTLAACEAMWWKDKDPMEIAMFLDYHEIQGEGFIQRLNQALRSRWHDQTVDDVLAMPDQRPCGSFNSSAIL